MSHRETNPHFTRPFRPPPADHPPGSPPPHHLRLPREEPPPPAYPPKHVKIHDPHHKPRTSVPPPPSSSPRDKSRRPKPPPPAPPSPPRDKVRKPKHTTRPLPPPPPSPIDKARRPDTTPTPQQSPRREPHVPRSTPLSQPQPHSHPRQQVPRHGGFRVPAQKKTKPHTWFFAVFCLIFWLVIIIGGLIVLIVYLIFRPQSPHFEVSSASLNAAYLDLGYLLNADVTLLANFTNPNKKVHVDFSTTMIYLYYGSTLIATQYVEPFSAAKAESRFATIHMVTSQVQLPLAEIQRLVRQIQSNGVILEVKGVFRARSTLGRILRYSYNLYGYCTIMLTRPPGGVLVKRNCRTKR